MRVLRRVLMTIIADCGQNVRPFLDGPEVRACDIDPVRREFYRQYPAEGTEKQKADARRKAFARSVKETMARSPEIPWRSIRRSSLCGRIGHNRPRVRS